MAPTHPILIWIVTIVSSMSACATRPVTRPDPVFYAMPADAMLLAPPLMTGADADTVHCATASEADFEAIRTFLVTVWDNGGLADELAGRTAMWPVTASSGFVSGQMILPAEVALNQILLAAFRFPLESFYCDRPDFSLDAVLAPVVDVPHPLAGHAAVYVPGGALRHTDQPMMVCTSPSALDGLRVDQTWRNALEREALADAPMTYRLAYHSASSSHDGHRYWYLPKAFVEVTLIPELLRPMHYHPDLFPDTMLVCTPV